jgi:probable rRNA maturation factor
MRMSPAPSADRAVAIDVAVPCADWIAALPEATALSKAAARAALAAAMPLLASAELSIVLADDALIRGLNREWRGKDAATNVLSFPAQDFGGPPPRVAAGGPPLPLGDIVLALATIRCEAAEQHKALADHLAHLVVHGVLHLVGFDHESNDEAERMEALERRVLQGLGVADPYAESRIAAEAMHG